MKRYYFDYAAATPVDPEVEKAMRPYWSKIYGNPGALHWFGQEASAAVFGFRNKIADILGCGYKEIIFTGSATEANNLVLRGVAKSIKQPKIIISAIEHESVLDTVRDLQNDGVEVVYLPVTKNGIVDLKKLKSLLDERTILVSIMYANNEIGTIQPIKEIGKIIFEFRQQKKFPLFHTDAVQAFNYLNCDVRELGVDLMTLSSQKIYGPKGIGLLYIKKRISIQPIITGGGQEFGLRGGTENVPAIAGFAKAAELVFDSREVENGRLKKLQEYFWLKIKKIAPNVKLNGDWKNRLPNNLNLYFPLNRKSGRASGGQDLLIKLDLAGFAVSPGAACSARVCQPSHVLKALGCSDEQATGSLRITFGRQTTKQEIDALLKAIKKNTG